MDNITITMSHEDWNTLSCYILMSTNYREDELNACIRLSEEKDENRKIYFDLNDGRNGLNLHTGAYRHPEDEDICGEPNERVMETVECDEPFVRHPREFDYMMLGRYKIDCDYFLGNGNGYEGHLYFKSVEEHCDEMEKLWNSFADDEKPEWLTMEQIKEYREKMLKARRK